jgi:hypothetical protein
MLSFKANWISNFLWERLSSRDSHLRRQSDRGWKAAPTIYTACHKNVPIGISGCRKKRLHDGTFFSTTSITDT